MPESTFVRLFQKNRQISLRARLKLEALEDRNLLSVTEAPGIAPAPVEPDQALTTENTGEVIESTIEQETSLFDKTLVVEDESAIKTGFEEWGIYELSTDPYSSEILMYSTFVPEDPQANLESEGLVENPEDFTVTMVDPEMVAEEVQGSEHLEEWLRMTAFPLNGEVIDQEAPAEKEGEVSNLPGDLGLPNVLMYSCFMPEDVQRNLESDNPLETQEDFPITMMDPQMSGEDIQGNESPEEGLHITTFFPLNTEVENLETPVVEEIPSEIFETGVIHTNTSPEHAQNVGEDPVVRQILVAVPEIPGEQAGSMTGDPALVAVGAEKENPVVVEREHTERVELDVTQTLIQEQLNGSTGYRGEKELSANVLSSLD